MDTGCHLGASIWSLGVLMTWPSLLLLLALVRLDAHARCGCSCAAACSNVADAARRRLTKTGGAG